MTVVLEVVDLSVGVLAGVSFTVEAGEEVALIGDNGSGKTTLLHACAGLLDPADVAFVADPPMLDDDIPVREQVPDVALLERLGLAARADDPPRLFSRGLRQRAALASALARPGRLLLVDEPFVGLDVAGSRAVAGLLAAAADAGTAVVAATHQADYAVGVPRVIGLRGGRVAYDGPPTDEVVAGFTG